MTYTTQDLIEILDQELQANWKGQRIVLSCENRLGSPVVSKAINLDKVNKVFAYRDFRSQIHQYQQEHQVSGIIWRKANFRDISIDFPQVHNQLIPIPGDKEILMDAKQELLTFWDIVTKDLNLWLMGDIPQQITPENLKILANKAEWAEIEAAKTEIYLGLCWGNPHEYQYKWALPLSGCDRIVGSENKPGLIKF